MVNMDKENEDFEVETTNDEDLEIEESELIDEEAKSSDKIKKVKEKLKICEEEKRKLMDDLQLAKADFLNARKRLEEERVRDRIRSKIQHVEELLPLCDSFQMAMSNKEAWEQADESWRKGIEGIHAQLISILNSYSVKVVNPVGAEFNPHQHEAVGTEEVKDKKMVDKVVTVMQMGYEMTVDGKTETIRPARVTTGIIKD